jgi:hypothetical protein
MYGMYLVSMNIISMYTVMYVKMVCIYYYWYVSMNIISMYTVMYVKYY